MGNPAEIVWLDDEKWIKFNKDCWQTFEDYMAVSIIYIIQPLTQKVSYNCGFNILLFQSNRTLRAVQIKALQERWCCLFVMLGKMN